MKHCKANESYDRENIICDDNDSNVIDKQLENKANLRTHKKDGQPLS